MSSPSDRDEVGAHHVTLEEAVEQLVERTLRRVLPEFIAATRVATDVEMVSVRVFAADRSLNPATVRQMAAAGRIDAVRIGKRQWRVRRDSPIGQPMARGATSADTPAERARRLVEKLK